MDYKKQQGIIESILFAAGREVELKELMSATELGKDELIGIIEIMRDEYKKENRGIEIIRAENSYQLCVKKENYDYIYPVFDKRSKPNLSPAALEVISIIAYNPKITRAEIEAIRGVSSDGSIYRLLDYELIEEAGKLDAPGRPTMYRTTSKFLKMFGLESLDQLPELPKYKLDENQQIVIDDVIEENADNSEKNDIEDVSESNTDNIDENDETSVDKEDKVDKEKTLELLRGLGGLDIAGLSGVFIGGALYHIPIVIDGVISAIAAMVAEKLVPGCRLYSFASHKGRERGMEIILNELELKPVIHADLALGEGTGAILLFPMLDMAMALYNSGTAFGDTEIEQYERFSK